MNVRSRVALALIAVSTLAGSVTGCGSHDAANGAKTINVYAAASLKSTFTEIGQKYEADNPGSKVEFTFDGSSHLVTQLTQGARADVFASADTANMDKAAAAGLLAGDPVNFASNTLMIVTRPGNPSHISTFADLTRPGLSVVICAKPVPCGSATQKVASQLHLTLNPVSEETSVTDVLNKVTSGQADAGVVYRTDAIVAGDKVSPVEFSAAADAVNKYPIAVLKSASDNAAANRFVQMVTGEVGQKILQKAGFAKP